MKTAIIIAAILLSSNAMAYDSYRYGGNYRSSEYSYRLTQPSPGSGYANADVSQPSYTKRQLARDMDALEVRSQIRTYDIQNGGNGDVGYGGGYYRY